MIYTDAAAILADYDLPVGPYVYREKISPRNGRSQGLQLVAYGYADACDDDSGGSCEHVPGGDGICVKCGKRGVPS